MAEKLYSNVFDQFDQDGNPLEGEGNGRVYEEVVGNEEKDKITTKKGNPSWVNAGDGDDVITGVNAFDMLAGNKGNDTISAAKSKGAVEIYGGEDNDNLTGIAYGDYIAGGANDDIIKGGKGNDTLRGGTPAVVEESTGADTFLFAKGDGNDIIRDASYWDVIKFTDRTSFAGLFFTKDGKNLVIADKYNNITVEGYFNEDGTVADNAVNQFALKNGVYTLEWKKSNVYDEGMYNVDIVSKKNSITSVAGIANWIDAGEIDKVTGANKGDMLAGNQNDDVISAAKVKGAVEIYGGEGNDNLTGSAYGDWIAGGANDDIIKGGKGNDILRGNTPTAETTNPDDNAKDTFLFYKGDGQDEIRDIAKDDVIKFADVNSFTQKLVGNDLVISYNAGKDSITVTDYLTNMSDFTIETKNGKQYSANVDELQAAVAGWLSTTGYADVATGLANGTDEQVANLVAIFENANINV